MYRQQEIQQNIQSIADDGFLKDKELFIFGVNDNVTYIIDALKDKGYAAKAIIDNDINKQNNSICNLPVIGIETLQGKENAVVLISSKHFHSMAAQLIDIGFKQDENIFQLSSLINKDNIEFFWKNRAEVKIEDLPNPESIVNFRLGSDVDENNAILEREKEIMRHFIRVKNSDTVVDLGAGIGRWSRFVANNVKKVIAVELVEKLTAISRQMASDEKIDNIEFVSMPCENFIAHEKADFIIISGLLSVLDDNQYEQVICNIPKYLKPGGGIMLRESISTNLYEHSLFLDRGMHNSLFRTPEKHIHTFAANGCTLKAFNAFDEDGWYEQIDGASVCYFFFTRVK